MAILSRELRKTLERVVAEAREVAEEAAEKALESLAVGRKDSHGSMTPSQKALRNRLRAHGRQLGDRRNVEKGTQELDHLVVECAYEHWHRMLFARFLAENHLLLEPESGVAIAVDEMKELARYRGKDWVVLAGEFAVRMLPQVFRQDDPVLEVQLAPEDRKRLEELLESLAAQVFTADDSLGWTYQFWQAEQKDAINASGKKIGADELGPVTQLFTEDYMVEFLLHNTLGAWWVGRKHPEGVQAASEEEARAQVALPGVTWTYLRFLQDEKTRRWRPAAGTFEGWPKAAKEITVLDPCMGSGHFLVFALPMIAAMRTAEEGLSVKAATLAALQYNLFGLELDLRCTQIAAFNLALSAWRRVGHCNLPALNLACSGLAPNADEADWLKLAGRTQKLQRGMERLYRLFKQAPILGSLINPRAGASDLLVADFHDLQPLLEKALALEAKDDDTREIAVTARGLAKAAEILAGHFTIVATNVPFLTQIKFGTGLQSHIDTAFVEGRANLATAFLQRILAFVTTGRSLAFVSPQSWWFLKRYLPIRDLLLKSALWNVVARLGEDAFQSPIGEIVGLTIASQELPSSNHKVPALDLSGSSGAESKAGGLARHSFKFFGQLEQRNHALSVVLFDDVGHIGLLSDVSIALAGCMTSDSSHFIRKFWEIDRFGSDWEVFQTTTQTTRPFGGMSDIILWENESGALAALAASVSHLNHAAQNWQRGKPNWGKRGIVLSMMGKFPASLYTGAIYDSNCCAIIPKDESMLPAIWAYCESEVLHSNVRGINQNRKVEVNTLLSASFDLAHWQEMAAQKYPHGLRKPFSSDPTQWLFNGQPYGSDHPLQVAVARLVSYQWPRQTGSSFTESPALGTDGLEPHADSDGIVTMDSVKGEDPAAVRLQKLLAVAYGKDWSVEKQAELLAQVNCAGESLDDWFRDGFFEQHCELFQQRPFVWHIWDGLRDGFHALVNYHKLAAPDGEGRRTLERLAFTYLGEWIARQRTEQKAGKEGADAKLAAALHLQLELRKILEGNPPYDIFVRWKPLQEQAIGWEPDISDGIRRNIRPFMMAETSKGKSIFREAPKIQWEKDRGKEPERPKRDFPWFWGWDEQMENLQGGKTFDGNRWNDLHYSNAVKEEARGRQKGKGG